MKIAKLSIKHWLRMVKKEHFEASYLERNTRGDLLQIKFLQKG